MASLIDPPAQSRASAEVPVTAARAPTTAASSGSASGADAALSEAVFPLERLKRWFRRQGYWYAASAVVHGIGFAIVALVVTFLPQVVPTGLSLPQSGDPPAFGPGEQQDKQGPDFAKFELGTPQVNPGDISTQALREMQAPAGRPVYIDESPGYEPAGGGMPTDLTGPELGGLGGFTVPGVQGIGGQGGVGVGHGTGIYPGSGGEGVGFGRRGKGSREGGGTSGRTTATDRAVLGGLVWLAKHQGPSGAWSLQHGRFCPGRQAGGCGGQGTYQSDVAATSLALLPFLGAGQTHQTRDSPFKKQVSKGLAWLIKQQAPDGNLAQMGRGSERGEPKPMYTHALGTIVLCEAYGMTRDPKIGGPASRAVRFIELAQNESTGGWRYFPKDPGDTSVVGWQVMALKSAQMAGLGVNSISLESPRKWLNSVAVGRHGGRFCYMPYQPESASMTAVGQLCLQYMGSAPDDAALLEGKQYLMANLPDGNLQRDIYYWYYATLVLHNYLDQDWDKWNRAMRRTLVNTQVREGCGTGSWDPDHPTLDRWGSQGGRLYMTSLSVLTLEVYYRYLPLFRLNGPPPTLQSPDKKTPPTQSAPEKKTPPGDSTPAKAA